MGTTSSLVMRLTSSMARTLSGSAIARNKLVVQAGDGDDLVIVGDVAGDEFRDFHG